MSERIESYEEFWPYYLREHSLLSCRVLHYIGTLASLVMLGVAVYANLWLLLAVPLFGYAPAWIGHFFIQKNRPATFTHPLWSLVSDFRMFALAVSGRLGPELERAGISPQRTV
jgi:hypothetical protein